MNLKKLIEKGRLEPIIRQGKNGEKLLIGWRRRNRSRKGTLPMYLKTFVQLMSNGDIPMVE